MTKKRKLWKLKVTPIVEAEQISRNNLDEMVGWCRGEKIRRKGGLPGLKIPTQYGVREAYEGDYLVKKMNGDFTVSDPQSFEFKYARVDSVTEETCTTE